MHSMTKLVEMFATGKRLSNDGSLIQRLLSGVAMIVGLSLITAMMLGMLLAGGLYFLYRTFIINGLDAQVAMVVVGLLIAVLIAVFVTMIACYLKKMRKIPHQLAYMESPLAYRVSNIADAFLDGFLGRDETRR